MGPRTDADQCHLGMARYDNLLSRKKLQWRSNGTGFQPVSDEKHPACRISQMTGWNPVCRVRQAA